jgi:two-component sensor histidine kinase
MNLLSDIDLPRRFRHVLPPLLTKMLIAGTCLGTIALIRTIFDVISPGAAPFALIFPAIMMATLFAGPLSGITTSVISLLWALYFIMPVRHSFSFADPGGPWALIVVAIASAITIAVATTFREAVRRAQLDRERQVADRDLFLREFDHRVKNNFAIVISLLELQRRRADPTTAEALSVALQRVEGISRAHAHLYRGDVHQPGTVEMFAYLGELCTALPDALNLGPGIAIVCDCDRALVPRDRAVSIGLIVNELVTNAAKHAFPDRDQGKIDVAFRMMPDGWRLTVADDGVGMKDSTGTPDGPSGLGNKLIEAFARQAGGTVLVDSSAAGTRVTVDLVA